MAPRGARAAPQGGALSKSAVSRIQGGLYLDAIALRVQSAGKVTGVPVLGVVVILADGQKQLVALDLGGGESFDA